MVETQTNIKDKPVIVKGLGFKNSFEQLTNDEKLYAYYFYKASWEGFPIVLFQMSPEAPLLFSLFQTFFKSVDLNTIEEEISKITTKEDARNFIEYAATVYDNAGNYRSFGFDKINIELSRENFEKVLGLSKNQKVKEIYNKISDIIFDRSEETKTINLYEKGGVTAYYLGGITEEEINKVDKFLASEGISNINTRLVKFELEEKGKYAYGYLVGSIENKVINHNNGIYGFYGDFDNFLKNLNFNLEKCKNFTKREFQLKMIDKYLESFLTGSIKAHKESQIEWIKDIKPVVETNLGWIESYVDPLNTRAYYEGFVALVDKENTKKFTKLVDNASKFLDPKILPYSSDFENYPFREPDYTQIDMLCFASDGCPMGINIPNYDDIREKYGFKNVTIGNNQPKFKADNINFMKNEDKLVVEKYGNVGTLIHTGCHELLGHGSGKLLREEENGYNFKKGEVLDEFTKEQADYYLKGETFESKFGEIARSYEECRADISGLYYGTFSEVHDIFGVDKKDRDDVIFVKWNIHFRKGLLGSKFYNPTTKKWGQAHTQGAYVFTQFILRNQKKDNPILTIDVNEKEEDMTIIVNKKALLDYGHDLVTKMLVKLNVWKATGNSNAAKEFYNSHSEVDDLILKVREISIAKTPKRALTVNHNLVFDEKKNEVNVVEYEESCIGIIQSYLDRFNDSHVDLILAQNNKWDNLSKNLK